MADYFVPQAVLESEARRRKRKEEEEQANFVSQGGGESLIGYGGIVPQNEEQVAALDRMRKMHQMSNDAYARTIDPDQEQQARYERHIEAGGDYLAPGTYDTMKKNNSPLLWTYMSPEEVDHYRATREKAAAIRATQGFARGGEDYRYGYSPYGEGYIGPRKNREGKVLESGEDISYRVWRENTGEGDMVGQRMGNPIGAGYRGRLGTSDSYDPSQPLPGAPKPQPPLPAWSPFAPMPSAGGAPQPGRTYSAPNANQGGNDMQDLLIRRDKDGRLINRDGTLAEVPRAQDLLIRRDKDGRLINRDGTLAEVPRAQDLLIRRDKDGRLINKDGTLAEVPRIEYLGGAQPQPMPGGAGASGLPSGGFARPTNMPPPPQSAAPQQQPQGGMRPMDAALLQILSRQGGTPQAAPAPSFGQPGIYLQPRGGYGPGGFSGRYLRPGASGGQMVQGSSVGGMVPFMGPAAAGQAAPQYQQPSAPGLMPRDLLAFMAQREAGELARQEAAANREFTSGEGALDRAAQLEGLRIQAETAREQQREANAPAQDQVDLEKQSMAEQQYQGQMDQLAGKTMYSGVWPSTGIDTGLLDSIIAEADSIKESILSDESLNAATRARLLRSLANSVDAAATRNGLTAVVTGSGYSDTPEYKSAWERINQYIGSLRNAPQ